MTTDITTTNQTEAPARVEKNFHAATPAQMLDSAVEVANVIAPVIRERGFCVDLSNGQNAPYVMVEGWILACAMLGLRLEERDVKKIDNYWEARVDLVSIATGQVVGGGSAICSKSERMSGRLEDNQIRSKAITRAQGRACTSSLKFIMKLAGFETTPSEEMEDFFHEAQAEPQGVADAETKTLPPTFDGSDEAKLELGRLLTKYQVPRGENNVRWVEAADNCKGRPWSEIERNIKIEMGVE